MPDANDNQSEEEKGPKRFRRRKDPPRIQIQKRDLEVLRHVRAARYLNSRMLCAVGHVEHGKEPGASVEIHHDHLLHRFKLLYDHKLLTRVQDASYNFYDCNGSRPLVYTLAREGAKVLAHHDNLDLDRVLYELKKSEVGARQMRHALLNSTVYTALELALRSERNYRVASWKQGKYLCHTFALNERDEIVHVDRNLKGKERIAYLKENGLTGYGVAPDALFTVQRSDKKRFVFMVEADTGTEMLPVIQRKVESYMLWHALGLHKKKYRGNQAFERFVVLFVTQSPKRKANMQKEIAKKIGKRDSDWQRVFRVACDQDFRDDAARFRQDIWAVPFERELASLFQ